MAKFYIITPVLNSLSWLKHCVYSVADQVTEGVEVYYFVQDGHQVSLRMRLRRSIKRESENCVW